MNFSAEMFIRFVTRIVIAVLVMIAGSAIAAGVGVNGVAGAIVALLWLVWYDRDN